MGCGVIITKESMNDDDANGIKEIHHIESKSSILVRYKTKNNEYKIKLTPPTSGK